VPALFLRDALERWRRMSRATRLRLHDSPL
jgi:hypothetical protein